MQKWQNIHRHRELISKMIKFYIVFVLCLFVPTVLCLSEAMQELSNMLHGTCVEESGVSEDIIKKVNDEKIMINDEKLKCYLKCLMSQTGSISDDGIIDVEAVIALLPEDMQEATTPVIRQCGAKVGANPCESAWLTHKCYLETKPEIYTLI